MNQEQLVNAARSAIQDTEAQLARSLKISPPVLNRMKKGRQPMPDHIAIELAAIAGLDPAATLAAINADKADKRTKDVWQEVAKRAAHAAAVFLAISAGIHAPELAAKRGEEILNANDSRIHNIHYAQLGRGPKRAPSRVVTGLTPPCWPKASRPIWPL